MMQCWKNKPFISMYHQIYKCLKGSEGVHYTSLYLMDPWNLLDPMRELQGTDGVALSACQFCAAGDSQSVPSQ